MPTTHASQRVLVIGLDVGDGQLIWEWAQEGALPTLHALRANGTWRWLHTTADMLHVSAWPSLYTGALPGAHGVYYTFQPAPGSQQVRRFGADQYGQPPVWQLLDHAGKRCIVFDAPYTHPARDFSGIQVFEWGTWAHYWRPMSTPAPILRRLMRHCGAYPVGFEANQVGLGALDLADLQQRLLKAAAQKARAVHWLMATAPWDLLLVVFGETHPAAHYFWPSPETADAAGSPGRLSRLREVYMAVDRAIGEILEQLDEDATVVVISGDGVGPNYAGWHLLPEVLRRLHYTGTALHHSAGDATGPRHRSGKPGPLKRLRDLVPADLRQALSRRLPTPWRDALMARWAETALDWSRTRAYCLPTDLEGCIRINLSGREPKGIVEPGAAYEQLCDGLSSTLQQLTNPDSGRPAVRRVIRTDAVFDGERRHHLPDLIVLWSEDAPIQAVHSPAIGPVRAPSPDARTGTHYPRGFALVRGPLTPRGHVAEWGHLVDFAPTLLAHFGLPTPPSMQGCVWRELGG